MSAVKGDLHEYCAYAFSTSRLIQWCNLSQNTDNIFHIMLYPVHLSKNRVRTHNFSGDRQLMSYINAMDFDIKYSQTCSCSHLY